MIDSSASHIKEVIERQVARPARSKTSSQNQPFQLHGSYYIADTISISTRHGIKSYAGDIKLCDTCSYTANTTLKKVNPLVGDEQLWTGESTYCICTHHVEQHCTIRDQSGGVITIHCHGRDGDTELCNCELFRARSIRIDLVDSHSNDNKIAMEDLGNV